MATHRITSSFVVLSCLAASVALAADGSQERGSASPQTIVSNTGDVLFVERGGPQGYDSFDGTAPQGMADDSAAEFASEELTAQEVWDLVLREAKTANIGRESVIGSDNRTKVNPTTVFPARAIGQITFTQRGGNFICSGWLVNKNTVVTAGHCVHEGDTSSASGWSTNVRFYPGRNGASNPYGSCSATKLFTVTGWFANGSEEYDYGAFKLNCNIGNTTGYLGFWWQAASLVGTEATPQGYPGDKPSGTQWKHSRTVAAVSTRQTFYQADTAGGQSGCPVLDINRTGSFCTGQCAHTIHAYGLHGGSPHSTNNHGTRITQSVFNNIQTWKNTAP